MSGEANPFVEGTEDAFRLNVGRRIRDARESLGINHALREGSDNLTALSQAELAEKLHVTATAVSYWEAGKREPSLYMLVRIADILRVDVAWLLTGAMPADARTRQLLTTLAGRIGIAANEAAAQLAAEVSG